MIKAIWMLSALMVVTLLAGCAGKGGKLEDTNWELTTLGGQPALAGAVPSVFFGPNGELNGTTGCNRYSGSYTLDGKKLTIQVGPMTMMACDEPVMKQEQDFLAMLSATAAYQMTNDTLTLKDASGTELATFGLLSPASLTEVEWTVISYNNGKQAVVSVLSNSNITAIFGKDNKLTGNGGCNNYNASYTVKDNTIKIGPVASTMMACEQDVMDQEQAYLAALQKAATYKLEPNALELRAADGALQVQFQGK